MLDRQPVVQSLHAALSRKAVAFEAGPRGATFARAAGARPSVGDGHAEALTAEERTNTMKKKPAAKSKRRAKASTRDLVARGKSVTAGREPTTHPAKVTVPDTKIT